MKKIFFVTLLFCATFSQAQILKKLGDKAKQKVEQKTTQKVDETTQGNKTDKTDDDENQSSDSEAKSSGQSNSGGIKAYSKYDFVPGEKVIGFEDFSTGNIGDFPAGWNTNGSGEIVTIEGRPERWLWLTQPGVFLPEFTNEYPEDFTFEFDLMHGVPTAGGTINFVMAELQEFDALQGWNTSPNTFKVGFYNTSTGQSEGSVSTEMRKNENSSAANQIETELLSDTHNPVHISIWRQKERIRVYVNEQKIWDIPKAISREAKLNAIFFPIIYAGEDVRHYIGNLRLAVGAPDTRKKMLEQNKWVTHGILFDVNKATIKPESYGTLKEMASVLKEFPELKVNIVGHTDADGKDDANLDLSKRRASSVKEMLAKEFGIDESRMETDGMGETEPIDTNDTPAGKANNRRVEFIKI